jgi:hypothetical protein
MVRLATLLASDSRPARLVTNTRKHFKPDCVLSVTEVSEAPPTGRVRITSPAFTPKTFGAEHVPNSTRHEASDVSSVPLSTMGELSLLVVGLTKSTIEVAASAGGEFKSEQPASTTREIRGKNRFIVAKAPWLIGAGSITENKSPGAAPVPVECGGIRAGPCDLMPPGAWRQTL